MWWQFLPLLRQAGKVSLYILPLALDTQFVRFGEDDGEGYAVLAQPFNKFEVYGQRLVSDVDEQEQVVHLFAVEHVVVYHLLELLSLRLASLRIAVARQIDEIPAFVYQEVVYEQRLAWC